MKLREDVLLEIVDIIRRALVNEQDASDMLRKLDLEVCETPGNRHPDYDTIGLSKDYVRYEG